jgi:nicotinamidase-related amidase
MKNPLDKPRFALLIVNMLKDMIEEGRPFKMPFIFKQLIVPKIKEFTKKCRQAGIPVIYICDAHRPNDPEFTDFPKGMEHAVKGTKGAEIIEELKPCKGDFVVTKRRFSGFFGTELECLLSELDVNSVIIVGRPTNVCVLYTAADAFFRGFKVYVINDCMYSANENYHLMGLKNMFFAVQLSADEFCNKFLSGSK